MIKNNDRIEYLDILKGIGIIVMIMGHVGFGTTFLILTHAFHMPLFFFVTGYLYHKKGVLNTVKSKARPLLLPYFLWGGVYLLLEILLHTIDSQDFVHLFLVNTEGDIGAVWFLTAMFFAIVIYACVDSIRNRIVVDIIVLLLAILGNLWTTIFNFRLPWALDVSLVAVGIMHVGRKFSECKDNNLVSKLWNLRLVPLAIMLLITAVLIFINGEINMRTGEYSFIPLFWINAILSIIVLVNISIKIDTGGSNFVIGIIRRFLIYIYIYIYIERKTLLHSYV